MSAAPTDAPLVDAHAHIFHRGMPRSSSAWNRPDYDYTGEDLLADLDAHGVHFGVIAGISLYGTYNDYTIDCLRRHRRLRGTVNVTPDISPLELGAMDEAGVVGIRLFRMRNVFGDAPDIRSDAYIRLLHRVRDLGWHVHFLANGDDLAETLDVLGEVGVTTVIDHFARCDADLGRDCPQLSTALRAMQNGRTWMKISAGFRFVRRPKDGSRPDLDLALDREIRSTEILLSEVGPERLIWGSDSPFVGQESHVDYAHALRTFENAVPDPDMRRAISMSALKLYFS